MTGDIQRSALYVVATPIGNLGDVTLRALEVLRSVALIAAEDTRVTERLLHRYAIDKPMTALHGHNERSAARRILDVLHMGQSVALTTDAGTPGISDPGNVLVTAVRQAGIAVVPIPGPSALTAAWSVSGSPSSGFLFHGFLPTRRGDRKKLLGQLAAIPYALIFYEAPHRVIEAARDLCEVLGAQRRIVVARELTKVFEAVHVSTLGEIAAWLSEQENRRRGELVLIVSAGSMPAATQAADACSTLRVLAKELPPAQAARLAARLTGAERSSLYDMAVELRAKSDARGAAKNQETHRE